MLSGFAGVRDAGVGLREDGLGRHSLRFAPRPGALKCLFERDIDTPNVFTAGTLHLDLRLTRACHRDIGRAVRRPAQQLGRSVA